MFKIIKFCCIWFSIFFYINSYADIDYYIQHTNDKIHVIANFGKLNKDNIKLYIPADIWGTDYTSQIKNIKVQGGKYNPSNQTATIDKHKALVLEYDIINVSEKKFLLDFANRYYHFFDQEKFIIVGLGFFIHPDEFEYNLSTTVSIYINSPAKKIIYNSPPYFYKDKIITKFRDLFELVILANKDFSYVNDSSQNLTIITWSPDKKLGGHINNIIFRILKQHKLFWDDKHFTQVAIIIPNPFISDNYRYGGNVTGNTLTAFINHDIQDKDLDFLINHEGLHFWFGENLIRGEQWFIEGFADYYVDKIYFHLTSRIDKFVNNYNEKLLRYFSSPLYKINDSAIGDNFFKIHAIGKLPYLKGYLMAGQIDSIIDLDSALKSAIKDCRGKNKRTCNFSPDFLFKYVKNISDDDKVRINNLITNFNNEPLVKQFLKKINLTYREIEIAKYNLDIVKSINNGFISGKYLYKLDKNYKKNKNYPLLNIKLDDKAIIKPLIKDNKTEREIILPYKMIKVNIPFYQ